MQLSMTDNKLNLAHNQVRNRRLMLLVNLLPGIAALFWFFGIGVLFNLGTTLLVGLLLDAVCQRLTRGKFTEQSDMRLMAVLLGISLPTIAPWWLSLVAIVCTVGIKHLIAWRNYLPVHPAMAAYVLLLLAFPEAMTTWILPQNLSTFPMLFSDYWAIYTTGELPLSVDFDSITAATPLDSLNTLLHIKQPIHEVMHSMLVGRLGGIGWEWVALAYLCAGLYLVYRDVIEWSVPAGVLGSISLLAWIAYQLDSTSNAPPLFHLFSGGVLLCAFFIAPEPAMLPNSTGRRFCYGVLIGSLIYVIRMAGDFPDGVALAVLLANLCTPLLSRKPPLRQKRLS